MKYNFNIITLKNLIESLKFPFLEVCNLVSLVNILMLFKKKSDLNF